MPSTIGRATIVTSRRETNWLMSRRSSAAEPPLAAGVLAERVLELGPAEVGPERVHEDELRVGALPEQEVRKPQLARGADHEIRIGQLGRVKPGGERLLVDHAGRNAVRD